MGEKNFDIIFSQIRRDLENQLKDENENGSGTEANGGGTINFELDLDGNGNGHYELKEKGFGVTISASAIINEPDAVFGLEVRSSDGGRDLWHNVRPGQELKCKLETSFWHKTTITVNVHSSVPNRKLKARLSYSY